MSELTFDQLCSAVDGDAVALRSITTLQPAGGANDKIFPPSYSVEDKTDHKYAVEERVLENGTHIHDSIVGFGGISSQPRRVGVACRLSAAGVVLSSAVH